MGMKCQEDEVVVEEEEEEEFTHWSLGNFREDSEIRTKKQVLGRRKRRGGWRDAWGGDLLPVNQAVLEPVLEEAYDRVAEKLEEGEEENYTIRKRRRRRRRRRRRDLSNVGWRPEQEPPVR